MVQVNSNFNEFYPLHLVTCIILQNLKFNIVPTFFNIGIDEEAKRAERLGNIGPQEKNNSDNFRILVEYVRKFKQKNYFNHIREFHQKYSLT